MKYLLARRHAKLVFWGRLGLNVHGLECKGIGKGQGLSHPKGAINIILLCVPLVRRAARGGKKSRNPICTERKQKGKMLA